MQEDAEDKQIMFSHGATKKEREWMYKRWGKRENSEEEAKESKQKRKLFKPSEATTAGK